MHEVARRERWIRKVQITAGSSVVIRRSVRSILRQLMLSLYLNKIIEIS